MKSQNHPYQKIINSRGLILRISYIIAIVIVIFAFKIETKYAPKAIANNDNPVEIIEMVPRLKQQEEVKVPEMKPEPEKKPIIIQPVAEVKVVDNNKKVEETTTKINIEELVKNPVVVPETVAAPTAPFRVVEQMPEYPGGLAEFYKYFQKNFKFKKCGFMNDSGKIDVEFIINQDGKASDVKILRGICPNIDEEVIRVIEEMPAWHPGKQRGQNVRVYYILPVQVKVP